MSGTRELIGQLLVSRYGVDDRAVDEALARQRTERRRLCSLLLRAGAATEEVLARALGRQAGLPAVAVTRSRFQLRHLDLVPRDMALREKVLPLALEGDRLLIAAADPFKPDLCRDIEFISGRRAVPHIAVESALLEAAAEAYRTHDISRDSVFMGSDSSRTVNRDTALCIIVEEMAVPELEADSDAFMVVTRGDDIGNIVQGRGVAEERTVSAGRVLVVDDEPDVLDLLKHGLATEGYDVVTASSGGEALQKLRAGRPDLVILDAMLPDIHGFEICRKIKSAGILKDIPVLMISGLYTGWRFEEDVKKSHGADDYIGKPFRLEEVVKRAGALMAAAGGAQAPVTRDIPLLVREAYNEGVRALKEERLDAAMGEFKRGMSMDPFAYRLHYGMALACHRKGMDYHAMSEYEKAVELKPSFFEALKNLALMYQQLGFRRKARETWERAMESAPDDDSRLAIKEHIISLL
jgi:DNA-binding response OmpR family regulator